MTAALPRRPVLRAGVALDVDDVRADLSYRDGGCVFDLDADTAASARRFLEALRTGGATRDDLGAAYPELPVDDVLDQLDVHGLLTDTPRAAPAGLTGAQAYRRARRCYLATMAAAGDLAPRQLSARLFDGTVTRAQLVGYAIEYYQVVAHCPRVLAPALALADDHTSMMLLRRFYQSEMNHDRMLLRSLNAVGIDPVAQPLQPLPSTFAMMASLGVLASTFPLGLKAVLFVLEEPQPEFNDAFVAESRRLGLPEEFVAPIAQHSDVNEGESHDDISADLFDRVGYVSAEEMVEIEKAVADMAEQLAVAGQEMADWYGAADEPRLRTW
jgi:hypothetical protein